MPLIPLRQLPDVDDLLRDVLGDSGVKVSPNAPADLLQQLPYVVADRFGGAAVHTAFLDRATCSVDCYAATRREAANLAETCRVLLYRAWRNQTRHADGSIAHFAEVAAPAELRTDGQADGLYRYIATYSLHIRP